MTSPSLRRIILLPRTAEDSPATLIAGLASERKDSPINSIPEVDVSTRLAELDRPDDTLMIDNVAVPRSLDPRMMPDVGRLPETRRRSSTIGRAAIWIGLVVITVCIALPRIPKISVVLTPAPTNEPKVRSIESGLDNGPSAPARSSGTESPRFPPSDNYQPSRHPTPAARLQEGEIARQLMRGQELLSRGEIAAARYVFQRVADSGEARGALALAETYEPSTTRTLPANSVVPDVELAKKWYETAKRLGSVEAQHRLELLSSRSK